jgi:hypothetical protein
VCLCRACICLLPASGCRATKKRSKKFFQSHARARKATAAAAAAQTELEDILVGARPETRRAMYADLKDAQAEAARCRKEERQIEQGWHDYVRTRGHCGWW